MKSIIFKHMKLGKLDAVNVNMVRRILQTMNPTYLPANVVLSNSTASAQIKYGWSRGREHA